MVASRIMFLLNYPTCLTLTVLKILVSVSQNEVAFDHKTMLN